MCPYTINMVEAYTEQLVKGSGVLEDVPVIASGRQVSSLHTGGEVYTRDRRKGYTYVYVYKCECKY